MKVAKLLLVAVVLTSASMSLAANQELGRFKNYLVCSQGRETLNTAVNSDVIMTQSSYLVPIINPQGPDSMTIKAPFKVISMNQSTSHEPSSGQITALYCAHIQKL